MYDDGFKAITNVDFSEIVIQEMQAKNQRRKDMSWQVMDMLQMTFPDATFDVVVDKGALDALFSEETKEIEVSRFAIDLIHARQAWTRCSEKSFEF